MSNDVCACSRDHDHKHQAWCYQNGGRCEKCLAWRASEYQETRRFYVRQRELEGRNVFVPAAPAVRKIRALACMGWSAYHVAELVGVNPRTIGQFRSGRRPMMRLETGRRIDKVYRQLCTTRNTGRAGTTTTTLARRRGWLSPAEWVNIEKGIRDE